MEITIVGAGNMGRAMATRALARARRLQALGFLHMARQGSVGTGLASTVKTLP